MATLVVSVDREGGIYREAGVSTPVVGEDAVSRLVTETTSVAIRKTHQPTT